MRGTWAKAGATTAYERAMKKVRFILENHQPDPLSPEILATIRSIIADTEAEMGIKPTVK